jgi:hypothetical protein
VEQPKGRTELTIEIAQQDEVRRQAELFAPGVMRPGRIDADAKDLRAQRAKLVNPLSELGKLVCSTRAEVEDVGEQDDRPTSQSARKTHGFAAAYG